MEVHMDNIINAIVVINMAMAKVGKFGEFGELLVNFIGAKNPADRVVVRCKPTTAKAIAKKMEDGNKRGMTVTLAFTEVGGVSGVRKETFTNKKGAVVNQTAVYFKMVDTPKYFIHQGVDEIANLDQTDLDEEGNLGDA
jgi:hypothetical protein